MVTCGSIPSAAHTIPTTIHYVWFGRKAKCPLNRACIDSWGHLMLDYAIKEWNEENSPLDHLLVRQVMAAKRWSKVSNYLKPHALYTEGGLYFDTEVDVLQRFDPLLENECFISSCRENPATLPTESSNGSSRAGRLCRVKTLRPACGPTAMR